jgi:hypothetical protein
MPLKTKLPVITIALVHGIVGVMIFLLLIMISIQGKTAAIG